MSSGLIGKKLGMSQIYDLKGKRVAVTLIEIYPNFILQTKDEKREGYHALQLATIDQREKLINKPQIGHFKKANIEPKKVIQEFRNMSVSNKSIGDKIEIEDIFTVGERINISGITKGKGFTGVVKKYGFRGVGEASHGQHNRLRSLGSIGNASSPSRVFKGKKMPGRAGGIKNTIRNLLVAKIINDENVMMVVGAIPGAIGNIVRVSKN